MDRHTPPLLAVNNLTLVLDGKTKINKLSFELQHGESLCLLGASGSGKSLTASAILGTLPPNAILSGSIRVCGREVGGQRLQQRGPAPVAAIFQDPFTTLNPLVSVGKQLGMALRYQQGISRRAADACASELLAALGLEPNAILPRYPSQLSGGQCQRICTALALSGQQRLLIADEPTTALDMVSQHQVIDLLRQYTNHTTGRGLLFITHDVTVAAALCQRAVILAGGQQIEQGPIGQIMQRPAHPYTHSLVTAARQLYQAHNGLRQAV
ncbi:ABC transporter ATP-binding protein [Gibbsiella quercinecans]|uniref:ATP-binding cassette domain-containing protein n=1 Tax=Gibbsiella quercinecans TaxID=929813 RepID=UPI000EF1391E|nr:ABC transporter ATP-binding protein [Gibbsiella quercinecans]RLM03231.1 dipeptide/oligopeptide/nickel ABC transporter ATP-binding protein [Gibbsiella quercinecans]